RRRAQGHPPRAHQLVQGVLEDVLRVVHERRRQVPPGDGRRVGPVVQLGPFVGRVVWGAAELDGDEVVELDRAGRLGVVQAGGGVHRGFLAAGRAGGFEGGVHVGAEPGQVGGGDSAGGDRLVRHGEAGGVRRALCGAGSHRGGRGGRRGCHGEGGGAR